MVNQIKMAGVSQAIHYRNYRRARERAMTRLVRDYPEQYAEYLQEERASDETTGKKWISAGATVGVATSVESYKDVVESAVDTQYHGEDEGDEGGEE